jgi:hypothetical protein
VTEYAFRWGQGVDIYQSRRCLPHPLVLQLFSWVRGDLNWLLLLSIADALAAQALETLAPGAGVVHLLNPLAALATASLSFAPVEAMLAALCVSFHVRRKAKRFASTLSVLCVLNPSTAVAFLPLLSWQNWALFVGLTVGIAMASMSSLDAVYCTWGCHVWTMDLRANVGLWWYLMAEVFASYEGLFRMGWQAMALMHLVPVGLRFAEDRQLQASILHAVRSVLKPYPTVSDVCLSMTLLGAANRQNYAALSWMFSLIVVGFSLLSFLMPLTWRQWVVQGNGNANFYFACTGLLALLQMLAVIVVIRHHLPSCHPPIPHKSAALSNK